ncbi:uncharacterized protein SPSC_03276 [Sporisorium scitamineum]|uniref:Serine aminopeptidase S33 domain-containing protein n=1 Tax=Sporisorium scitamineum TaxID=49012 RepID=A0A127Z6Y0_9BASI|nr:uncharacterized protein SPSC_03276 [Sporisorium scitamineum]
MSTKPKPTTTSLSLDLLRRSLYLPLTIAAVYIAFFLALLTPLFQRHLIFLHAIQFPLSPNYGQPSKYGLAPFKTRTLTLTTSDGEKIGAWHILPEVFYQSQLPYQKDEGGWGEEVYSRAMREYPTILYLHGNSMNRAAPWRVAAYCGLTGRMDVNVVAIDYRGFGDSTGVPSEEGLVEDGETAWRWIREQQGGVGRGVVVFGQSLGTGVGALLAAKLEARGEVVDGLVLMAPYTDLKALVKDFRLGGLLPLLKPIAGIPFNNYILDKYLKTHFRTIHTLPLINHTPIVLLHARNDPVIPITHSHHLFSTLLSHHHPSLPIQSRTISTYAHIQRFHPSHPHSTTTTTSVTLIETHHGGHNQLTEGALDLVRLALRLPSHLDSVQKLIY